MPDEIKLWSISYRRNGAEFVMHVLAAREEVESHCANLGLSLDGEVVRTGPISSVLAMCFGLEAAKP